MQLYDALIKITEDKFNSGPSGHWDYDSGASWFDTGSSELVLQKDAAFELGASGLGSANYVLFTSSSKYVNEDSVSLYGPDLSEIPGNTPFARIVLLRVGMLDMDDEALYRTLKDIEFSKYHVYPEGYMIRMSPETYREQVRVSRNALKKGINFKQLGMRYIKEYKKNPNVLNAKVIFVTDPSADFTTLVEVAKKAAEVTGSLSHLLEGLPTDCSVCALKGVCEEVEGMKELHFGINSKQ